MNGKNSQYTYSNVTSTDITEIGLRLLQKVLVQEKAKENHIFKQAVIQMSTLKDNTL